MPRQRDSGIEGRANEVRPLDPSLLLFVPGDRPDRFTRALTSDATGIILDLEDAVQCDRKGFARNAVRAFLDAQSDLSRVTVRVNHTNTTFGRDDLAMLSEACRVAAVVVPKVDCSADLDLVSDALDRIPQIAMIESAMGIVHSEAIARGRHVVALAFGPYDLAASLGGYDEADVMLPHRAHVLVVARAAGIAAIDGPSREFHDIAVTRRDAFQARRLGFDGKLLIHPKQIATVRDSFAPSESEIVQARRIIDAAQARRAVALDGAMIDAPILLAARRTLQRAVSSSHR
jgi:citrate lyase subunit beta/citryl-CoA lyase